MKRKTKWVKLRCNISFMTIESTELQRLTETQRYLELGFERDQNLRDIAFLASNLMDTPVSLITLMDKDTQIIITPHGIDLTQMPRASSFCTHAIMQEELMLVSDTTKDERFKEAPLVVNAPNVRFYAGANLKSENGSNIGTLCVFDNRPREVNQAQLDCLKALSRQVSTIMNLNLSMELIRKSAKEIEDQYKALSKIAFIQSHEVRVPLCKAVAIMDMIKMDGFKSNEKDLLILEQSIMELDEKIHSIVYSARNNFNEN